jgi:hypothetical protein
MAQAGDVPQPHGYPADTVIKDQWPKESETAYQRAAAEWTKISTTHDGAAATTGAHRQESSEWTGESGLKYQDRLGGERGKFQTNAEKAKAVTAALTHVGGTVRETKMAVTGQVEAAKTEIKSTMAKAYAVYGVQAPSKPEVQAAIKKIEDTHRDAVKNLKNGLDSQIAATKSTLEDGLGPPTQGTPGDPTPSDPKRDPRTGSEPGKEPQLKPMNEPGTSGGPGSGEPGSGVPAASEGGGGGDPVGGGVPESVGGGGDPVGGMPEAGAPGGGMPGGGMPGGGMPQMPQMPQQMPGEQTLGKGMDDLKDMVKPGQGQGQDGTTMDDDTLQKLLEAQGDDEDAEGDTEGEEAGDEGEVDEDAAAAQEGRNTGGTGTSTPSGTGAQGAVSPVPAGPSPASPVVTGTPGAAYGPVTELSGSTAGDVLSRGGPSYAGPSGEAPGAGGAPGVGGGIPGALPPMPRTGGVAGPSGGGGPAPSSTDKQRTPRVYAPTGVGNGSGNGKPTDLDPETVSAGRTFLDDLPPETAGAHRVLAALSDQFLRAGWAATPIAVGVFRRTGSGGGPGGTVRFVYATADAVSVCPLGVLLPSEVTPLGHVDGVGPQFATTWGGVNRVVDKLTELASDYPELLGSLDVVVVNEAAASTVSVASGGLTVTQRNADRKLLCDSGLAAPVDTARYTLSQMDSAAVSSALNKADTLFGDTDVPDSPWREEYRLRAARLWAARRSAPTPDPTYPAVLAAYLLAEAHAASDGGSATDAAFSLSELLDLAPATSTS